MRRLRIGIYPGSFNPPTTAHLAIAAAVREQRHLDHVIWAVSTVGLEKGTVAVPSFADRLAVLRQEAEAFAWLGVVVTEKQLIADIAAGYDVVILGADKWHQIHDVAYYEDGSARDAAIASLPSPAIVGRAGLSVPPELAVQLDGIDHVSSSAARGGDTAMMGPAARAFDAATGAWSDPDRYRRDHLAHERDPGDGAG